jgi:hypothetical protein
VAHEFVMLLPGMVVIPDVWDWWRSVASWPGTLLSDAILKSYGPFQTASFHCQAVSDVDHISGHAIGRAIFFQKPNIDQSPQRITHCVTFHPTRFGDLERLAVTNVHQIKDVGSAARQAAAQPDMMKWINQQPP